MIEVKWELRDDGYSYFMFRLGDYNVFSHCYRWPKGNKRKSHRATFIRSRKDAYVTRASIKEPVCTNPLFISPSDLTNWIKWADLHYSNNMKEKLIELLKI